MKDRRATPPPRRLQVPRLTSLITAAGLLLAACPPTSAQDWSCSYGAASSSATRPSQGGSEILHLVGHGERLFAAVGFWEDGTNVYYGGKDPRRGWARVIRLDAPGGAWEVDLELGPGHVRPEILEAVTFHSDGEGQALDEPVTLLMACAYATGLRGTAVHCFVREQDGEGWAKVRVLSGPRGRSEAYSVRDVHVHRDAVTGVDHVVLSIGTQGILTGVYDPDAPGRIAWQGKPEFGPLQVRPLGITTANGTLYFSAGNRIYRRVDGPKPRYEVAHDLSDLATKVRSDVGGVRGLTAVATPGDEGQSLLFMWSPDARAQGEMIRLDPAEGGRFTRHREVVLAELIQAHTGASKVQYVLGAYNQMLEVGAGTPDASRRLVGLEFQGSGEGLAQWKRGFYRGALYAIRDADRAYRIEEVGGAGGRPLVATRCYVRSPFEGDRATYFGGHDPNGIPSTGMAWVHRREDPPASSERED